MKARTIKTEAIVLRKRSLINQDSLITLFSQELGKINVFAKGIKKITSRRLPHVQTANLITAVISQKEDRLYLQETSLISAFSQIKKTQKKVQSLYFLFFILERLLPEHQKEDAVYAVAKSYLIASSHSSRADRSVVVSYVHKVLELLGYSKGRKSLDELIPFIEEIIHEKIPDIRI